MKKHGLIISTLFLLTASVAHAQLTSTPLAPTTRFLSIPSSGFTPRSSEGFSASSLGVGYNGNRTGTARMFEESFLMFAPVNLPHDARVTSMHCGGRAPDHLFRIMFTLRRNEPQRANVDMATVMTTFEGNGFQFVDTSSITSAVVNNARFNS